MKSKFDVKIDDKSVDINIIKFSDGTIQMNLSDCAVKPRPSGRGYQARTA